MSADHGAYDAVWAIMDSMALFATVRRLLIEDAPADQIAADESGGSFGLSPAGLTALTIIGLGFLTAVATLGAGPVVAEDDGTGTARPTIFCPLSATVTD